MQKNTATVTELKSAFHRGIRRLGGDCRTHQARQVRETIEALASELLGDEHAALSASQAAALERCATLQVLAREVRQRALMGDAAALYEVARIENLAARSLRQVGISSSRRPQSRGLAAYLSRREAAS